MKNFLKSTLIALLLLGATAVSQASHNNRIYGPNVLGTSLFGDYEGDFRAAGRTLPFTSFYMSVYPNGYVQGYLQTSGRGKMSEASAYFSGSADKKGNFDTTFSYGDKYYTLKGQVNKSKKAVGVAKPYRKNNAVGALNGTLSRYSYAPSSIGLYQSPDYYYYELYGNDTDIYFYFYNDGTFEADDYSDGYSSFEGDYSYTKLGNNLARLTIYTESETHVILIYNVGGNTIAYDVGTGKFHHIYRGYGE